MALLRSLAARVRTSAASVNLQTPALRPSAAAVRHRLSPPPGSRSFSSTKHQQRRTKINLESASLEELEREAAFLREQIDEVATLMMKQAERSDLIMKDNWDTLKLMACFGVVVKVITFAISPHKMVDEEAEESLGMSRE